MSVSVKIHNPSNDLEDSFEFQCALSLKESFEKELNSDQNKEVKGEISIFHNIQMSGQQDVRDIDLLIIGNLDNYQQKVELPDLFYKNKKNKTSKESEKCDLSTKVENFCITIELKTHREIKMDGFNAIYVRMGKNPWDYKNVTKQSERQKYGIKNYLEKKFKKKDNISPFNLIWLPNMSQDKLTDFQELDNNKSFEKYNLDTYNVFTYDISISNIFKLCIAQNTVFRQKEHSLCSFKPKNSTNKLDINKYLNLKNTNVITGELTRERVELITKKIIKNQNYVKNIGKKLTIISGKPGTGKTIKLLRLATDLSKNHDKKTLILTYNKLLVSDISRILFFTQSYGEEGSLRIQTIHQFFYRFMENIGLKEFSFENFIIDYDKHLKNLLEYFTDGALTRKDLIEKENNFDTQLINWDYVMIDEAQDCTDLEKDLLYEIFERNNIVISQSKSQLVRRGNPCIWQKGLVKERYSITNEKKGLRQKLQLTNFVNQYAKKQKIDFNLDLPFELPGGNIIISTKTYFEDKELHERLVKNIKDNGNDLFDLLFLHGDNSILENRQSLLDIKKELKENKVNFWDGSMTPYQRGDIFPDSSDILRFVPYNVCRGLEGWIVVCNHLDEFILSQYNREKNNFKANKTEINMFEEKNEIFRKYIYSKALIPLTRAIDTTVITLKNKNSKVGLALKEIYKSNKESIEWIE